MNTWNYKYVLFSIYHKNNANEIKHTRNKKVCTSFDRLTTEPVWNIIYELKRCVFNKVLNWSREWVLWICAGSLFQRIGAITENAWSPYLVLVRGPRVNCKVDDDRRGLKELEQRKEIRSERYLGAWPWRILYIRRRTLNVIRWCMGSQWRKHNIGVMCSDFLERVTSLAAVFCILWSGSTVLAKRNAWAT